LGAFRELPPRLATFARDHVAVRVGSPPLPTWRGASVARTSRLRAEMTAERDLAGLLSRARLYLVATPNPAHSASQRDEWLSHVVQAAEGGVDVVQLRAKGATTAMRRDALAALRTGLGRDRLLIVNDDLSAVRDVAGGLLADGVHLGREDAAALAGAPRPAERAAGIAAGLREARGRLGPSLLLGTSARTLAELRVAVDAGASYVGFGAMARSATKPDSVVADPLELRRCVAAFPGFPIFPIGGLDLRQLDALVALGCRRAAIGSAILDADDPAGVAAACKALLEGG
jgi:thiamine-phosphate pyrophosphorylase